MPRTSRVLSETNIYHIMQRGINHQKIFLDDEDRQKYLSILRQCKSICGFDIYAYCLMDNHIHLLLKVGKEPLDMIFKRINCRFVYWYNLRHQRSGPLFDGRFRSESVEDDAYFLTVLRYIHQNPVAAGLSAKPENYRWSSYFSYSGWPDGLTDSSFAMEMFPAREALLSYLNEKNDDQVMDVPPALPRGVTDEEAQSIMASIAGAFDFPQLDKPEKQRVIRQLYERGISLRQISRLIGVNPSAVARAIQHK